MTRKIIPNIVPRPHPKAAGRVCSLSADTTVLDAVKQMEGCNIAALAVVDEDRRLIGIVTERDITRRVVGAGLDASKTRVDTIMTPDPDRAHCDDTAHYALALMQAKHYRHLPVVDDDERVLAMVSIRHLSEAVERDLEHDVRQRDAFITGNYGVDA